MTVTGREKRGGTRRAVVIGNATVDETYAVEALPRPGESLIGRFVMRDPGGKGANVATVLARAGVPTTLVAAVGDDERGAFVRERFGAEPLETLLVPVPDLPTDLSLVHALPDGDNAIVTTVAATRALDPAHAAGVLDALVAGDLVVLQANLERVVTLALIEAARKRALEVVLNPSPLVPWIREAVGGVQVLFANEAEARELTGRRGEAAVRALLDLGPQRVVVTRGAAGAVLGTRTGERGDPGAAELVTVPAVPARAIDTTGAGDTFLAVALASAIRRGTALDADALEHAARGAAITVGRRGTASAFPSVAELSHLLG